MNQNYFTIGEDTQNPITLVFKDYREMAFLFALLFSSLIVRVLLFPLPGNSCDLAIFSGWIGRATENGIRPFYNIFCEYPPVNVYLFWGFGNLAKLLGLYNMSYIFYVAKFIPTLFDMATAGLIYVFVRTRLSTKSSLVTTALYAFNPAVIFNASVWGQWDAIYTFFVVLSLMFALKSKSKLSAAVCALAILTKPQAIAILPLIALLIYKKNGVKNLIFSSITFVLTVFLVILPFQWSNPVTFLSQIYFGAYGLFKYISVNAFNTWSLYGLFVPDGNLYILGWVLFGALVASVLYVLYKRFDASDEAFVVFCAFILFFGFFMLQTRMHERYLFPVISLLTLTLPFIKKARPIYVVLTGTLFFNQAYILSLFHSDISTPPPMDWTVLITSTVNVLTFVYALILLFKKSTAPKTKTTISQTCASS